MKIRNGVLLFSLLVSASAFADDQISVTVNGTTYQCSGGSTPPPISGVNLCRCREVQYSAVDYDYVLEKYNAATTQYRTLQNFAASDTDHGSVDRQSCETARQDPSCYFPD